MSQAITDDNFGAWVLKCNPATWDLDGFLADGGSHIDSWSVQDNYRSARMRVGDPVVFWVTGAASAALVPGIWGAGVVVAPVEVRAEVEEDDEDAGYWLDADAELRANFFVVVDLPLFEQPIPRQVLVEHPVLSDAELVRQPQMGNPSWLTAAEWVALQSLLEDGAIPDTPPQVINEWEADAAVQQPDPVTRALIEARAVALTLSDLDQQGWLVEDVQAANLGWDLTARRGDDIRRIEVKGRGTSARSILLTANEYRAAHDEDSWEVALVTSALTKPELSYHPAKAVLGAATAVTYKASLS